MVIHLYQEIETLKRQLGDRDRHIVQMETAVMTHAHSNSYPDGELEAVHETVRFWQEKVSLEIESARTTFDRDFYIS